MPDQAGPQPVDLLNPATQFVNRLPDMSGVLERLLRNFRTQLFQEFRLNVQTVDGKFDIISHDEYLTSRQSYCLYGVLNIAPIRGLSLVTIEGALLGALVDELFGASSPSPGEFEHAQISIMEARIGRRLIEMLGRALRTAFEQYVALQIEIIRTEGFAALATVGDAAEPFCTMTTRVGLTTGSGTISIALPYRGLEPFREILGSPAGGQAELEARSQWADRLADTVDGVPVEIGLEIGTITISARALADLAVGTVLPLSFHRNARAMIGDTPVAEIRYGAVGTTYGVSFSNDRQDP
ncbi:hypothetical protein FGG78_18965 [Thioclava sp. BHET1]|nr:hypothetical protein FGG78_18965 [Thioclava sp. BHET1]